VVTVPPGAVVVTVRTLAGLAGSVRVSTVVIGTNRDTETVVVAPPTVTTARLTTGLSSTTLRRTVVTDPGDVMYSGVSVVSVTYTRRATGTCSTFRTILPRSRTVTTFCTVVETMNGPVQVDDGDADAEPRLRAASNPPPSIRPTDTT